MFKRSTVTAALAAFLLLTGMGSSIFAQDKAGGGSSKGGAVGAAGSDPMSARGFGDPRGRPGMDRPYIDPAGSRVKDPALPVSSSERVYDPAGSRIKEPLLTERVYDPAGSRTNIPSDRELERFSGLARQLKTTPSALGLSFEKASKADPNLTFGEFITANVVARGLNDPNITTGSILLGYQKTKSLGKILKSLGVAPAQADTVENLAAQQLAWTRLYR